MPSSQKLQILLKPNCTRMFIGWSSTNLRFLFRYEIQNGGYGRTQFNIGPYGKNVLKRIFSETTWTIETKLPRNDHWKVLYKVSVFLCRSKIQDGRHRRTQINIGPYGKMFNAFFSETSNMIKATLYMNVHWMVLYKLEGFLF